MIFVLVDLGSQALAVAAHVDGWSRERLLDWLAEFGSLQPVPQAYDDRWLWEGPVGLHANLYFPEPGVAILQERTGGFRPKLGLYTSNVYEVPLQLREAGQLGAEDLTPMAEGEG